MASNSEDPLRGASAPSLKRTTQSLQRIARAVVGDQGIAEDIVQSAWIEALRGGPKGRGLGWLRALVRSRSIDAARRRARRPRTVSASHAEQVPAPQDELAETLEVQKAVLEAVESLTEPYRSTVYLRYFEELGPQALAKRQGVPIKTVKTRLTRAHDQLRERLGVRLKDADHQWSLGLLGFAGLTETAPALTIGLPTSTLMLKKICSVVVVVAALFIGWKVMGAETRSIRDVPGDRTADRPITNLGSRDHIELPAPGPGEGARNDAAVVEQPLIDDMVTAPKHGALRVQVLRNSGVPAEGVHVVATMNDDNSGDRRSFRRRTDGVGHAFFPKLPLGSVSLETDRRRAGGPVELQVRGGEVVTAQIMLLEGVRVTGRVLDEQGRPVPGASLWLTARLNRWAGGGDVGRADAHGYFSLEDVPPDQSIGAFADGFLPSKLFDLDARGQSPPHVEMVLTLKRGGARLTGQVVDGIGLPVADALVVVAGKKERFRMRSDQSVVESWSPRTTRTDSDGHYSISGLRPGSYRVEARSFDYAAWSGRATLEAGATTELGIVLQVGAIVSGRVTYPSGEAASGALVTAYPEALEELYLQSGQVDYDGALATPSAIADESGRYELRQVPCGEVWIYAMEEGPARGEAALRRYTKEGFSLKPGSMTIWNPRLTDGLVLEGRVFYSDGESITGVFAILSGPGGETRGARVSDEGFRFTNLGQGPYSIRIQMWSRPPGALDPHLDGLVPGGAAIEVVASFPAPKVIVPAAVDVRLVDDGQRAKPSARVVIARVDRYGVLEGTSRGDRWSFQVADAGTYRAVAQVGKRVIAEGETFVVSGGEKFALPDLVTKPGGTLVLRIDRPINYATEALWAVLRAAPTGKGESVALDDKIQVRLENMESGAGILKLMGGGVAQTEFRYEIQPGKETVLDVPLVPAVPVEYQISWPLSDAEGTMQVRFTDRATGQVAHDVDIEDLTQLTSPARWKALLPPGRYLFEVKKNGAIHASETFEITTLDPDRAPRLGYD